MMDDNEKKVAWKDLEFVETLITKPPATLAEAHRLHAQCFSRAHNFYHPTKAQQFFVAKMIRLGGYHGRLIVNGFGQFFPDVRGFYVEGLEKQYKDQV